MVDSVKKMASNMMIKLGEHSVGKCMIPGMFDPHIPSELKEDICLEQNKQKNSLF